MWKNRFAQHLRSKTEKRKRRIKIKQLAGLVYCNPYLTALVGSVFSAELSSVRLVPVAAGAKNAGIAGDIQAHQSLRQIV